MTPLELRTLIAELPERVPLTDALEAQNRPQSSRLQTTWYRSQKEHWLGWLGEYGGPGAYGRKNIRRDARFIYNHFQCLPGLVWLAEALGVEGPLLVTGQEAMADAKDNLVSQCAAFRRVVPWDVLEPLIKCKRKRGLSALEQKLKRWVSSLIANRLRQS